MEKVASMTVSTILMILMMMTMTMAAVSKSYASTMIVNDGLWKDAMYANAIFAGST